MTKPATDRRSARHRSIIPGFGLTLGFSVLYMSLVVLLPLSTVFVKSAGMGVDAFIHAAFSPRTLASYKLSFGAAAAAAAVNMVAGLLVAWVLVRYEFPGKRLLSAMVDLPFALPTAVAGISLTAIYANTGWVGYWLAQIGIKAAYSQLGVVIALIFIGLPFVVRSVEPVLADLGADVEEAAASLGAGRLTTFCRVVLPAIAPALLTGFASPSRAASANMDR
jgi:sulfate transport system permease protein